ncbi:uncharacterized protein TNCV_4614921 [Trichonephila clavipes]|nr:uncharacterized protein TNCV_4614921 [Trichonephila clavipes]
MGTGFNSKIIKDTSPKQKVSYLTPINFSPTNVAVVTHTMEQAQVVGKECNQTYVQVTYDLAIAKIAYKIRSTSKPQFNNLFIHLDSFHLIMAFFKAIGVFINECGLSHMMIESNIIASGSVNGLVEGKHFNRCKRLHPLMALGLKMLHFDHFLDNIEYNFLKEQVIDDLLHYQEVIDSHSSMPIELPNNVFSRVLSAYQIFVEETRQGEHGKTAQFYLIYIQLVNYYITLSRSIRMGDFQMCKYVIPKITNLFFAVNQPNYARCVIPNNYHSELGNDFNKSINRKRNNPYYSKQIRRTKLLWNILNYIERRIKIGNGARKTSIHLCRVCFRDFSLRPGAILEIHFGDFSSD